MEIRNLDDLSEEYREALKAEQWQYDLLLVNPDYIYWGNGEDYMTGEGRSYDNSSWFEDTPLLDEYNECVNFYFGLYRESVQCTACGGEGLNPATKELSDTWYDFEGTGKRWCDKITDVEVLALAKSGRIDNFNFRYSDDKQKWIERVIVPLEGKPFNVELKELDEMPTLPSAESINAWQRGRGLGHDAINRWICIKARAEHLGVYGECEHCFEGEVFTEDRAKVFLQLWMLHPRKGRSIGIRINNITQSDLPSIFEYLRGARDRNNERFAKI